MTLDDQIESVLFRYVNLMINRGQKEGGCGCPSCYRDAVQVAEWYLRLDEICEDDLKFHLKDHIASYETTFDDNYQFVYDRYLKLVMPKKPIDWGENDA